jgi:very-short-patch-repair endonuclease
MPRDGSLTSNNQALAPRRGWAGVAAIAADQYGVVSLEQVVELGVAQTTVRGWVASQRLIRLHRSVFAVGHASLRAEGNYLAAVLACGRGAALSHVSAAALWGLRPSAAATIDVTSPIRSGRRKPGLRVHRGDRLHADEVSTVRGVPCTTVARTLLDLAAVRPVWAIRSAVETAERLELFDLRTVTVLLARHRRRRGVARLREVLSAFDDEVLRARSETEARFYHLFVEHRLAPPLVNRLVDAAGERFEVDLHWPEAKVIVEVDSPYHDTVAARERDAHRDAALTRAGWTVIRVRWADVAVDATPLIVRLRRLTHGRDGALSPNS